MKNVICCTLYGRKGHYITECWKYKAYGKRAGPIPSKPQREDHFLHIKNEDSVYSQQTCKKNCTRSTKERKNRNPSCTR